MITRDILRNNIDVLEASEHRWAGQGHFMPKTSETVIYAGREKGGPSGISIILTRKVSPALLGYNPISDRILTVRQVKEEDHYSHAGICTNNCIRRRRNTSIIYWSTGHNRKCGGKRTKNEEKGGVHMV